MREDRLLGIAKAADRGLTALLSVVGLGFVGLFYLIAYRRFRFPLQLEWAEGGVLDMVRRVVWHQQVYAAPSKDFVAYMYTPVYYYLSAALSHFTGVGFAPLRLLSVLATTGCLAVIFLFVRQASKNTLAAWVSAALFAALYAKSNGWFDLARVDMLYLFFLLLGIYLSQRGFPIWAAVVFAIAFQTKQSASVVAVLVLAHEFRRPRKLIEGLGIFAVLAIASSWWIDHINHGWYHYYTVFLPSHQAWMMHKFGSYWLRDLAEPLGVALIVAALGLTLYLSSLPEGSEDRRQRYFVLFTTLGLLVSTLTARLHLGGTNNVTLPMMAWICMVFGLALHTVLKWTERAPGGLAVGLRLTVVVACLVQFAQLSYSPELFVPTSIQKALAAQLIARVQAIPGKVFVLHNVIDPGMMGKPGNANSMAVWDVLRADHGPAAQNLRAEMIQSFEQKEYAAIIADGPPQNMLTVETAYLKEITDAASASYPQEQRVLSPVETMLFYANQATPTELPQYIYLPR